MIYSKSFIKTFKETPRGANSINQALLTRAGYISQVGSGIFAYLPLGLKVYQKVEEIILKNLKSINVLEVALPLLHPAELWKKSGRFSEIGEELIKISTGKVDEFVLAMTHEEAITEIAKERISSMQDLPIILGQISKKIRNEVRPRGGLIRLKEFQMQDAYSFHKNQEELDKTFNDFVKTYQKIFSDIGLKTIISEADPGIMGGQESAEFMLETQIGEDRIYRCEKCQSVYSAEVLKGGNKCLKDQLELKETRAIELAHVFKLGTKYSERLGLSYQNEKDAQVPVLMGCYGLGLDRLIGAVVEESHDDKGIIWPKDIAPFKVYLIDLEGTKGQEISETLEKAQIEVLFDDREVNAGVKFSDADLLGIPYRIVVSSKTLEENKVEIKERQSQDVTLVELDKLVDFFNN